jgi:hypothetical protein
MDTKKITLPDTDRRPAFTAFTPRKPLVSRPCTRLHVNQIFFLGALCELCDLCVALPFRGVSLHKNTLESQHAALPGLIDYLIIIR